MTPYEYPPNYDAIKYWVQGRAAVNHSDLQLKYNLRYAESKPIINALQHDGVIGKTFDINLNGYEVKR